MTLTIHRSFLVVLVSVLVIAAGVFVSQRASAASATPVVYVATGENFPDALGAASAAAVQGGPVLLVTKDSIPGETRTELSRLKPDVIYVSGGEAVVSNTVFNALKAFAPSVLRLAGANRYATAAAVSESAFPATGGGDVAALTAQVAALQAEVDALQAMLSGVTRNGDTLEFSGMNLQVVNGMGNTSTSNSLGNVIIGYNEDEWDPSPRTGSHYLVVGKDHSWTSWAGILAGYKNTASASHASVTGGFNNMASWEFASVTGGSSNNAAAMAATISGGEKNTATGEHSSVSGGSENTASAGHTSVSGGFTNTASLNISSILGGSYNTASGFYSSVAGGTGNTASGYAASVLGGLANAASTNNYASVCGGLENTASGVYSSVLGGTYNTASAESSSVSGGSSNTASGACSSVVGGDDVYLTSGGLTCRTAGEGFWNPAD